MPTAYLNAMGNQRASRRLCALMNVTSQSTMCLILGAHRAVPGISLLLVSNRDEFYERAAASANVWREAPDVVAGRDLKAGGTWLATSRGGRVAAVTNVRDPGLMRPDASSRGAIPVAFVRSNSSARGFARELSQDSSYNGFNVIAWDGRELVVGSNHPPFVTAVDTPFFGISNGPPGDPWPKVEDGLKQLRSVCDGGAPVDRDILTIMQSSEQKPDARLPDTGVGLAAERQLSSAFVAMGVYGTRCTSIVRVADDGSIRFVEYSYVRSQQIASVVAYQCTKTEGWHQSVTDIG